ncbi:MAG TPA: LysR family transcriptional regulator [Polyangiales bacterium]|nr:LysR family transcriptional regulator [Polyangiales bacterium]
MEASPGILAFVRTAELGSLTRAARALGVTPSGIGKSIARLENELGVRLLQRTTRRIRLTEDGALFFEHGRRVLDELEAARNVLSNRRGAASGRVRVSLPLTIGRRIVVPALPDILRKYPELRIEIGFSDRRVNLLEDGVDVAVRVGALTDSSLIAKRIGEQQVITIGSVQYLGARRIDSVNDLSPLHAIVFRLPSTGVIRPWRFRATRRAAQLSPTPYLAFDDGEAIVAAVAAGLGVAQVPSYMADMALASGEVVELLPKQRPPLDPIHAVYPSQRNLPARMRVFVEFLASLPALRPRLV